MSKLILDCNIIEGGRKRKYDRFGVADAVVHG